MRRRRQRCYSIWIMDRLHFDSIAMMFSREIAFYVPKTTFGSITWLKNHISTEFCCVLLWGVCSGTYRGDHEYYDDTIAICFALTNYHISLRPLDAADATFYKHTLAAYIQEGKERKQKEDEWRRRYRIRRTQREEVDSELLSIESSQELI